MLEIMSLSQLEGHDVYEFCYPENYPENWNENSIFVSMEYFSKLAPFLDAIFENYHYYGPQKVELEEWKRLGKLYLSLENESESFKALNQWISKIDKKYNYFWILGV